MPDDDGVVVTGGDSAAELLAVLGFKVFPGGSKDVCRGIQAKELRCPLLGQVVRDNKERLLTQAKPLALHCRRDHLERLPSPYLVGKQRISSVEDVGHSVQLMLTELDFRVHTAERDVTSIIFPGTSGVEKLVVLLNQIVPPCWVFPYPFFKSKFYLLLFCLCYCSFFFI